MVHGDVEGDLVLILAEEYSLKDDFGSFSDDVKRERNPGADTWQDHYGEVQGRAFADCPGTGGQSGVTV